MGLFGNDVGASVKEGRSPIPAAIPNSANLRVDDAIWRGASHVGSPANGPQRLDNDRKDLREVDAAR